jgi:hypothetical protein
MPSLYRTWLCSPGEVDKRRGIGEPDGERLPKLAGRVDITEQDIGDGVSVRLTGQPKLDNRTDALAPRSSRDRRTVAQSDDCGRVHTSQRLEKRDLVVGKVDGRPVPALGLVLARQTQEQHHDISGGRRISCGSNELRISRGSVERVARSELDRGTERLGSSSQGLQPADHSRWVDRRAAGSLVSGCAGQLADDG